MQRYFAKNENLDLYDSDIHHIKTVMRMKENDLIEVVYDQKLYLCQITNINNLKFTILKNEEFTNNLPNLTVAVALVKEQKFDLILQKLTELGVDRIIPINMERSIVKLDKQKEHKKLLRWKMICKEASEQSKRTTIPQLDEVKTLKELVNVESDLKLVCSTNESNSLKETLTNNNYKSILFVIGPEGGITQKEEQYLVENSFTKVSFGPLILRVETACIYIASIINYLNNF